MFKRTNFPITHLFLAILSFIKQGMIKNLNFTMSKSTFISFSTFCRFKILSTTIKSKRTGFRIILKFLQTPSSVTIIMKFQTFLIIMLQHQQTILSLKSFRYKLINFFFIRLNLNNFLRVNRQSIGHCFLTFIFSFLFF